MRHALGGQLGKMGEEVLEHLLGGDGLEGKVGHVLLPVKEWRGGSKGVFAD
jgi:hypothetical protein